MTRKRAPQSTLSGRVYHAVYVAKPFSAIPEHAWRWMVALQVLLMAAAAALPQPWAVVPLTLALVTLVGNGIWRFCQRDVRRGMVTQPLFAFSGYFFAGAAIAFAAGLPGLSWFGEALHLSAYVLLIASTVVSAHLRGPHDRASWIDAAIYAVSMSAPLWAYWAAPALAAGRGAEAVVYSLLFVASLFTGARLVLGGGHWNLPVLATVCGGIGMMTMDFLVRGPLQAPIPLWVVAAPSTVLCTLVFLHPGTAEYFLRGVRVGGMSIATRLGLLACSAAVPMAVLAAGFVDGNDIDWGVYAIVFVLTSVAIAVRVELTRRAGLSVWRPGALGAGATLVLFAVTGVLAALGQGTEHRRAEAAALSEVVIALQPLDGQMARAIAAGPAQQRAVRTDWTRQVDQARDAILQLALYPGTGRQAASLSADLRAYVEVAREELRAAELGRGAPASSAAAYRRAVGDAHAATRIARQQALDRARATRTVTVLLSAATVLLIAGLLLGYGAMQRRAELAAREAIDDLTGLGSRAALLRHLQDKLEDDAALARGEDVAVVSVDILDGRRFRDSLGDAAYHDLLRGVADRLLTVVRDDDIVSRPRNDGFAVALAGRTVEAEATVVAQRIVGAFVEPIAVEGSALTITVSIGVAFAADVPGDEPSVRAARLLKNGDLAAGDGGRSERGICVFAPAMEAAARERIELAAELRRGIERGELRLFYQPLIDLATGLPAGYEALMRWQHPTRGLVSPGVFIPVAERAGLIGDLGGWALKEACRQLAEWQAAWGDVRYVSVNVAAAQLQDGKLLEQVYEALEASDLPPDQLQLEVTESSLMEDLETADRIMRQVQLLGVRWALDDFGTGYSSLSYLRRFPVQVLKIDKSFVDDITDDDTGGPLVAGIIDMARNLRLTVVAEGIEDAEQGMRVRAMGGEIGQGYLFSRPLPPEQVSELGRSTALPAAQGPPRSTGLRLAN